MLNLLQFSVSNIFLVITPPTNSKIKIPDSYSQVTQFVPFTQSHINTIYRLPLMRMAQLVLRGWFQHLGSGWMLRLLAIGTRLSQLWSRRMINANHFSAVYPFDIPLLYSLSLIRD